LGPEQDRKVGEPGADIGNHDKSVRPRSKLLPPDDKVTAGDKVTR
jgi:hypothetical protein